MAREPTPRADDIIARVLLGLEIAYETTLDECKSHQFAQLIMADDLRIVADSLGVPYTGKVSTTKAVLAALRTGSAECPSHACQDGWDVASELECHEGSCPHREVLDGR